MFEGLKKMFEGSEMFIKFKGFETETFQTLQTHKTF